MYKLKKSSSDMNSCRRYSERGDESLRVLCRYRVAARLKRQLLGCAVRPKEIEQRARSFYAGWKAGITKGRDHTNRHNGP